MVEMSRVEDCVHHWIIDFPSTRQSTGRCTGCEATREFSNLMPDWESGSESWGSQVTPPGRERAG